MSSKQRFAVWAGVLAGLVLVFLVISVANGQSERNERQQIEQQQQELVDAFTGSHR